jgi:hypothetical protein
MMVLKKIIVWFFRFLLFLTVLSGLVASVISAVITVIPDSSASKTSILGYKAHCSFTPISTIILIISALVFGILFIKIYGKRLRQITLTESHIMEMAK